MLLALSQLKVTPDYLLVDAVTLETPIAQRPLIHGDARSISIAAASIVAKDARDRLMDQWARLYPRYGLERNRGYGTPAHLEALGRFGPSPHHRFSFAPVREAICWAASAQQAVLPLAGFPPENGLE
jgi:ribonuclease HII